MRYFLGVDVGGTKTQCLVAGEDGQVTGFGQSGPGNHEVVGYPGLQQAIEAAVGEALKLAGLPRSTIAGAGFGIAGYDWPSELLSTLEVIQSLGFTCPLEVVNDTILGLIAGASQGWGVVLIAGTGNNCRGRDARGREGRITGNGNLLGENGGASELIIRAVQAVNHAWIRRGPQTLLSEMFMNLTGNASPAEFIEGLVMETIQPDPAWAPAVFQIAAAGDAVAQECIAWNAHELGESACGVIRQLEIENEQFEVVMTGSLFEGGSLFTAPLQEVILQTAPRAKFVRLEAPPVVGGVLLAMQRAGLETSSIRQHLLESVKQLSDFSIR